MKAAITASGRRWYWSVEKSGGFILALSPGYTRRSDAKRGLIRFLKGMKKGVEVPE